MNLPAPEKITAALALCPKPADRTLPTALTDAYEIRDRLNAYPLGEVKTNDLLARITAADPATFDTTLDECAREHARRTFVTASRAHGAQDRLVQERLADAYVDTARVIAERLAPVFATAKAALTESAPHLPNGPDALDPAAILAADARDPFVIAHRNLGILATLAAAVVVPLHHDGSTPLGAKVAALAGIPDTVPISLHPLSSISIAPDRDRAEANKASAAVRKLVKDYATAPNLAVLDLARGKYVGVELDWPASPDDIAERVERIAVAHKTVSARESAGSAKGW